MLSVLHILDVLSPAQCCNKLIETYCRCARWWQEYADRKNDEEDEHVADSLLYDRSHLPRTIPAPDCVVVTPVPTKAPPPLKAAVVAPAVVVPAMVVPAAVPAAAAAAAQASVQVSQ